MISNVSNKSAKQLRVVICGSMFHYEAMVYYRDQLNRCGIPTLMPDNEHILFEQLSREKSLEIKSNKSRIWLEEVKSSRTYGILVVNECKRGIDNYIGANTFAEIAIAFNAYKQIFLLHDLYAPYEDELLAWRVVPLSGHLEGLISAYRCTQGTEVEDSLHSEPFQKERVGIDGARNGSPK